MTDWGVALGCRRRSHFEVLLRIEECYSFGDGWFRDDLPEIRANPGNAGGSDEAAKLFDDCSFMCWQSEWTFPSEGSETPFLTLVPMDMSRIGACSSLFSILNTSPPKRYAP